MHLIDVIISTIERALYCLPVSAGIAAFGGVPRKALYDNMKTLVIERDVYGDGQHRESYRLKHQRQAGIV